MADCRRCLNFAPVNGKTDQDMTDRTEKRWRMLSLAGLVLPLATAVAQTDTAAVVRDRSMDEVVVTGTRNATDLRQLPMTVSVIGRQQLEESHQTSMLPVLNQMVPGFFSASRGILGYGVSGGAAGQMSMRGIGGPAQDGLPTTGLLVLIDGHPQYMGLMGHPIADAYQTMMAERVEVVRGPASVLYGSNAMGGVVNIVTRQMKQDGVRTHFNLAGGSYGTLQGEATNSFRKGRFSSVATVSYGRSDGHRPDMSFEQYGGYAKLGYELTSTWRLSGDVNVTHFNAENPGAVDEPYIDNDQRITRGMTSLALENHYRNTSGALSLFYNWGKHWINDGYEPGDEPLDYRFKSNDDMWGISWYQSAQLFRGNRLTAGVDYFHFGGKSYNQYTDGRREISADKALHEIAGYLDFRQDVFSWATVDVGVRVDHHSQTGTEAIPQAGLAFRLPRQAEIKLRASKGFRNPTIREMFMFPPQNPDLKPERLWHYELSYAQSVADGRLHYEASAFYINGDNLIMRLPNPAGSGMLNQNSGRIENWGAEGSVDFRMTDDWELHANYSWLHMEHPVLASPEHKLYGGAVFHRGRWNAATGLQYVKGLYTEIMVAGSGRYTTEDFLLWDAQVGCNITHGLSAYVRGENLLAQRYEMMAGYPMPRATVMVGVNFTF